MDHKEIGLIVNPVAGIGGKVGLKGSDGKDIQKSALEKGARPEAPSKATVALKALRESLPEISVLTYEGAMGQEEAEACGFDVECLGAPANGCDTSEEDTVALAKKLLERMPPLILFAGGDGTARVVLDVIGDRIPVIGIPAGVKIHSGVYAVNPKNAGRAAARFLSGQITKTKEAEVMDLDEVLYRKEIISPRLYGYMDVPDDSVTIQNAKMRSSSHGESLDMIATDVINSMEEDVVYLIGAGTTTRNIMMILKQDYTLIGVDALYNRRLIGKDLDESRIYDMVSRNKTKLIITAIGGQGHIFGRGNQQISPRVIRKIGKENIEIIATKEKLLSLPDRRMLLDTGDESLDSELSGYVKVITGLNERTICRVESE